jgi:hypothetical protein
LKKTQSDENLQPRKSPANSCSTKESTSWRQINEQPNSGKVVILKCWQPGVHQHYKLANSDRLNDPT